MSQSTASTNDQLSLFTTATLLYLALLVFLVAAGWMVLFPETVWPCKKTKEASLRTLVLPAIHCNKSAPSAGSLDAIISLLSAHVARLGDRAARIPYWLRSLLAWRRGLNQRKSQALRPLIVPTRHCLHPASSPSLSDAATKIVQSLIAYAQAAHGPLMLGLYVFLSAAMIAAGTILGWVWACMEMLGDALACFLMMYPELVSGMSDRTGWAGALQVLDDDRSAYHPLGHESSSVKNIPRYFLYVDEDRTIYILGCVGELQRVVLDCMRTWIWIETPICYDDVCAEESSAYDTDTDGGESVSTDDSISSIDDWNDDSSYRSSTDNSDSVSSSPEGSLSHEIAFGRDGSLSFCPNGSLSHELSYGRDGSPCPDGSILHDISLSTNGSLLHDVSILYNCSQVSSDADDQDSINGDVPLAIDDSLRSTTSISTHDSFSFSIDISHHTDETFIADDASKSISIDAQGLDDSLAKSHDLVPPRVEDGCADRSVSLRAAEQWPTLHLPADIAVPVPANAFPMIIITSPPPCPPLTSSYPHPDDQDWWRLTPYGFITRAHVAETIRDIMESDRDTDEDPQDVDVDAYKQDSGLGSMATSGDEDGDRLSGVPHIVTTSPSSPSLTNPYPDGFEFDWTRLTPTRSKLTFPAPIVSVQEPLLPAAAEVSVWEDDSSDESDYDDDHEASLGRRYTAASFAMRNLSTLSLSAIFEDDVDDIIPVEVWMGDERSLPANEDENADVDAHEYLLSDIPSILVTSPSIPSLPSSFPLDDDLDLTLFPSVEPRARGSMVFALKVAQWAEVSQHEPDDVDNEAVVAVVEKEGRINEESLWMLHHSGSFAARNRSAVSLVATAEEDVLEVGRSLARRRPPASLTARNRSAVSLDLISEEDEEREDFSHSTSMDTPFTSIMDEIFEPVPMSLGSMRSLPSSRDLSFFAWSPCLEEVDTIPSIIVTAPSTPSIAHSIASPNDCGRLSSDVSDRLYGHDLEAQSEMGTRSFRDWAKAVGRAFYDFFAFVGGFARRIFS
ncbi:hypothetical protein EW146_g6105 [Bondarzewia mesenterica]|uniref:Uncharacterized protein n=1 Tax=Bondarzewia mesenterica TaxID=1095465 RepID=A0A4V3XEN2_9AGAM|nr:hypothetical protein EW146_g6105 [Bondarzewia mesenterica]